VVEGFVGDEACVGLLHHGVLQGQVVAAGVGGLDLAGQAGHEGGAGGEVDGAGCVEGAGEAEEGLGGGEEGVGGLLAGLLLLVVGGGGRGRGKRYLEEEGEG